jgi:hypothetical protein
MKLARFAVGDGAHLGLVDGDRIYDLTAAGLPFATMLALVEAGRPVSTRCARSPGMRLPRRWRR